MSKETQETLKTIEKQLATITNLLAYQMVEGKTLAESAPVLRRLGITPSEIAAIFGSTAGAVSVRLAEAKKRRSGAKRK
jgi:DNA-directed RNA polymerase specialized sigma24 family protein